MRCYNVDSGKLQWERDGHTDYLNRACMTDAGVVTAGRDCTLRRWDTQSGRLLNVYANNKTKFQGKSRNFGFKSR